MESLEDDEMFIEDIKDIGLENIAYIFISQKFLDENAKDITSTSNIKPNYNLIKNKVVGFSTGIPHVNIYIDNTIDTYKIIPKSDTTYYGTISADN